MRKNAVRYSHHPGGFWDRASCSLCPGSQHVHWQRVLLRVSVTLLNGVQYDSLKGVNESRTHQHDKTASWLSSAVPRSKYRPERECLWLIDVSRHWLNGSRLRNEWYKTISDAPKQISSLRKGWEIQMFWVMESQRVGVTLMRGWRSLEVQPCQAVAKREFSVCPTHRLVSGTWTLKGVNFPVRVHTDDSNCSNY